MHRPFAIYPVIAIQLFFAVLAFPSGYLFVSDPTGGSMGVDFALPYLPVVRDFFLVGLFLIVAYGIVPLVITYGLLTAKPWVYVAGLAFGAVAVLWILVEVATMYQMGFLFFQPLIAGLGALEILLITRPAVRTYLSPSRAVATKNG